MRMYYTDVSSFNEEGPLFFREAISFCQRQFYYYIIFKIFKMLSYTGKKVKIHIN